MVNFIVDILRYFFNFFKSVFFRVSENKMDSSNFVVIFVLNFF